MMLETIVEERKTDREDPLKRVVERAVKAGRVKPPEVVRMFREKIGRIASFDALKTEEGEVSKQEIINELIDEILEGHTTTWEKMGKGSYRRNERDKKVGNVGLMIAARVGCWEVVELLIAYEDEKLKGEGLNEIARREKMGVYLDRKNSEGETAVMLAAKDSNHIIMDMILKAGADATLKDDKGRNALYLHLKAQEDKIFPGAKGRMGKLGGQLWKIYRVLKEQPGWEDQKEIALMTAVKDSEDGVAWFLKAIEGTKGTYKDDEGNTALMVAAKRGNRHMVDRLISISLLKRGREGVTQKQIIRWIIKSIIETNAEGLSALELAFDNGHIEVHEDLMRIIRNHEPDRAIVDLTKNRGNTTALGPDITRKLHKLSTWKITEALRVKNKEKLRELHMICNDLHKEMEDKKTALEEKVETLWKEAIETLNHDVILLGACSNIEEEGYESRVEREAESKDRGFKDLFREREKEEVSYSLIQAIELIKEIEHFKSTDKVYTLVELIEKRTGDENILLTEKERNDLKDKLERNKEAVIEASVTRIISNLERMKQMLEQMIQKITAAEAIAEAVAEAVVIVKEPAAVKIQARFRGASVRLNAVRLAARLAAVIKAGEKNAEKGGWKVAMARCNTLRIYGHRNYKGESMDTGIIELPMWSHYELELLHRMREIENERVPEHTNRKRQEEARWRYVEEINLINEMMTLADTVRFLDLLQQGKEKLEWMNLAVREYGSERESPWVRGYWDDYEMLSHGGELTVEDIEGGREEVIYGTPTSDVIKGWISECWLHVTREWQRLKTDINDVGTVTVNKAKERFEDICLEYSIFNEKEAAALGIKGSSDAVAGSASAEATATYQEAAKAAAIEALRSKAAAGSESDADGDSDATEGEGEAVPAAPRTAATVRTTVGRKRTSSLPPAVVPTARSGEGVFLFEERASSQSQRKVTLIPHHER